jgi:hypothetical protein
VLDVRRAGARTAVTVKVTRRCPPRRPAFTGAVRRCATAGAWVNFAGARGRTGRRGRVKLTATLALPGRYRALARKGGRRGLSRFVSAGPGAVAARPARPWTGAG